MITYRAAFAGAGVLALVAILVLLLTPAARADHQELLVAPAATGPFTDQLPAPLFRGAGPLVPRDSVARTFWVQNDSDHDARATVTLRGRGGTSRLERGLTVSVDAGDVHSEAPFPADGPSDCSLTTTGPTIPAGHTMPVEVELAVADLRRQVGMAELAAFDVHVTLGQVGPSGLADVCGAQAVATAVAGGAGDGSPADLTQACEEDVVVTSSGSPTCVPTVVDAGTVGALGGGVRELGQGGAWALLALALGTGLLLGARRRRPAPRHRAD